MTIISFSQTRLDGATVIPVKTVPGLSKLKYVASAPSVRRLVREVNPDILHANYATSYGFLGAYTGFHPLLCTPWGTDVLISPWQSTIYRRFVEYALSRADLVSSMSDQMNEVLVRLGVPQERLLTVVFGIDPSCFSLDSTPRDDRLMVSTRNLEPTYDVGTLIRALNVLRLSHPDLRCLIAGEGSQRVRLETEADSYKLSTVEFVGRLPHAEIANLLRRATVYISTSISDGNSSSLLEAMASGAFPIVTDIPANREWIASGENGLLFPVGDHAALSRAIACAMSDEQLLTRGRHLNQQLIKSRALWPDNMARLERAYESLALRGARGKLQP